MTGPAVTIEENEPLTQAVNAMVKNKVKAVAGGE
jgi:CBS domain-containing protein